MSANSAAPTAAELKRSQVVQFALEAAWSDSLADDSIRRHEEGGWIYLNLNTGFLEIDRAPAGIRNAINLSNPPIRSGCVVVAKFHTHPNPVSEGWALGPSESDHRVDAVHGVPDLIRAEDGVHVSGPDARRGGLSGSSGYPD